MCADYINDVWKWLRRLGPSRCFSCLGNSGKQRKTTENNKEQRTCSLFFRCRNRQRPRVSADDAISFAVILREIQRKQREWPDRVGDQARRLGAGIRVAHVDA